jgi:hypothetical protein
MAATADPPDESGGVDASSLFYDTLLDWLILGLLALEGLVAAWLGFAISTQVDRAFAEEVAAEFLASPDAGSFPLTEAELADAIHTVVVWAGGGLAVAGLVMIGVGVWFRRYRGDVRERLADGRQAPRWHAPLLGGLLATALLFVPFAQVLGGGVAGYLSDRSATVDGALAGVVFGAPAYLVWVAVVVGALVAGLPVVAFALVFILLVYLVVDLVLAAIGGLAAGLLS